ncbi:zinc-dependent metalloprotease [Streptomyces acidiscabies]|uniref:Zinc-dependent metalloprotease n=1 Tax=Streptomyces acidiscabies TaxID=42234 RepID=A0ABU4MAK4_9ACTN|nr:zinc-dependent metalloprotease [Streptomyces acidiscabies]MDX3024948.1 zinc-dependent metalloprotease [Streptomyces acidiscabies]
MTTVLVQIESLRHEELADRIRAVAEEAAPWVEKITGLSLPRARIDLSTVDGYATAWSAFHRRQLDRDTAGAGLTEKDRTRIAVRPDAARFAARFCWMVQGPFLVATSIGQPVTLLVPESLDHLGVTGAPDLLCSLLVRILTEQAQVAASDGALFPPPLWPRVRRSHNAREQLSAGHARWAQEVVTPEILGRPASLIPGPRPHTYRVRRAADHVLLVGERLRTRRAAAFTAAAVSSVGLPRFNEVWSSPGAVPTVDELRHPARWIARTLG